MSKFLKYLFEGPLAVIDVIISTVIGFAIPFGIVQLIYTSHVTIPIILAVPLFFNVMIKNDRTEIYGNPRLFVANIVLQGICISAIVRNFLT